MALLVFMGKVYSVQCLEQLVLSRILNFSDVWRVSLLPYSDKPIKEQQYNNNLNNTPLLFCFEDMTLQQ